MSHLDDDQLSDNEIFFGKLTLKEFKKHILWNNQGPSNTNACVTPVTPADTEKSLQIIQVHSQPNLGQKNVNSPKFSSLPGSPYLTNVASSVVTKGKSEESFVQMEDMVEKLCLSSAGSESLELNNTLEVIDYILNNGPNMKTNNLETEKNVDPEKNLKTETTIETEKGVGTETEVETKNIVRTETDFEIEKVCLNTMPIKSTLFPNKSPKKVFTPLKNKIEVQNESPKYFTPVQSAKKHQAEVFSTPSVTLMKARTPKFKTPATASLSHKKPSALSLRTPGKTNAYQHITSPVASYINKSPQVPLVKDVHPRKPLPGPSFIPKFVKNPFSKAHNKENINLPSIAYKSAKKTKVIDVPDEEKLPQSQWAKQITSTLPRPTVMKHEIRNKNILSEKLLLNSQEDSFGNLSCVQADVSVCTQKTAFKSNKQ